uniref:Uncharacterized protein n=1 Tax=Rhizophora mucronata TaxID=61149 RepID=A0A2P2NZK3_RHIMU
MEICELAYYFFSNLEIRLRLKAYFVPWTCHRAIQKTTPTCLSCAHFFPSLSSLPQQFYCFSQYSPFDYFSQTLIYAQHP